MPGHKTVFKARKLFNSKRILNRIKRRIKKKHAMKMKWHLASLARCAENAVKFINPGYEWKIQISKLVLMKEAELQHKQLKKRKERFASLFTKGVVQKANNNNPHGCDEDKKEDKKPAAKPLMIIHLKSLSLTTIDLYKEHAAATMARSAMDSGETVLKGMTFVDKKNWFIGIHKTLCGRSCDESAYTMCAVKFAHEEWGSGWNSKIRWAKEATEKKDIETSQEFLLYRLVCSKASFSEDEDEEDPNKKSSFIQYTTLCF
eukprot:jgi/Psemu1/12395/gm1.12395_g